MTIKKLLKLNLNRKKLRFLKKQGIVNGCGGKGGFNFSHLFDFVIREFPKFNNQYSQKLYSDMTKLCGEHDIYYWVGNSKVKRFLADLRLAKGFFKLLHWTTIFRRIILFLTVFFGLRKYGKKYYNYLDIKDLDLLLKDI